MLANYPFLFCSRKRLIFEKVDNVTLAAGSWSENRPGSARYFSAVRFANFVKQAEVSMRSLQDRNGKISLWYGMNFLVDLRGNPVAIVKDGLIYSLKAEPVASWKFGNVIDLDGTTLLKRGFAEDGPGPRLRPLPIKISEVGAEIESSMRKPWGSELAFVETLRLVSRDFRLNGQP